jgi:hypothetical protein
MSHESNVSALMSQKENTADPLDHEHICSGSCLTGPDCICPCGAPWDHRNGGWIAAPIVPVEPEGWCGRVDLHAAHRYESGEGEWAVCARPVVPVEPPEALAILAAPSQEARKEPDCICSLTYGPHAQCGAHSEPEALT